MEDLPGTSSPDDALQRALQRLEQSEAKRARLVQHLVGRCARGEPFQGLQTPFVCLWSAVSARGLVHP
jgi:hypothetical protein